MDELKKGDVLKGGEFLIKSPDEGVEIYPEQASEELKMLAKTAQEFAEKEIVPLTEELEGERKYELNKTLLRKAAQLGLTMADIPEEYGGLGLDKISSAIIKEKLAINASFSATIGAHCVIGTLPIVYFGTEEQKKKYLPSLATAEKISAYALTEPTAGSDAMSIKTKAELSPDRKYYIMNGSKQWITNSGFADMFVVYAKVDGEKFTGFIVERNYPGVSVGPEEKKMGLHGSSTCAIYFEDAKVPVENVLGEIGRGHKIAFNTLNLGRFSLAASSAGGCKRMLKETINYAGERKQFNKFLHEFGMIKRKLADMCAKIYGLESIVFRIASYIEGLKLKLDKSHPDYWKKMVDIIEEHNIEDSIAKVYGSETLGLIIDHAMQIFGGYGYMQEYPVERAYRDARINRVFEGTNEINRLVTFGTLIKRTMKGIIPIMDFAGTAEKDLKDIKAFALKKDYGELREEVHILEIIKRLTVLSMREIVMKYMQNLEEEQMLIEELSNALIEIFVLDSMVRRVLRVKEGKERHLVVLRSSFEDSVRNIIRSLKNAGSWAGIKEILNICVEVEGLLQRLPYNSMHMKKELTKLIMEQGGYPFGI